VVGFVSRLAREAPSRRELGTWWRADESSYVANLGLPHGETEIWNPDGPSIKGPSLGAIVGVWLSSTLRIAGLPEEVSVYLLSRNPPIGPTLEDHLAHAGVLAQRAHGLVVGT